ncbi:MAG TPA: DUF1850 domain-containing protein [Bacillus sp. (in: firmicutes)]|nr:DUF1850 domain-containing protein [Bacillus sp. (in: firmicutes)]
MKKAIILFYVSVIGLFFLLFIPLQYTLVFEYENTGKLLAYMKMDQGREFQIKYTHSIHLSDVLETYEIDRKGTVTQKQLEYEDFAIGMPSDAQGNEKFIEKDGRYIITDMNRTFQYVDLRIGQIVANHTLLYNKKEVPFSSFIKEGTWIRIDYRRISLWEASKGVNVLE